MATNNFLINVTGTTSMEIIYNQPITSIATANVFFNGAKRKARTTKKPPYYYISSMGDEMYILVNPQNQFKATYQEEYVTKGTINGGNASFTKLVQTETDTEISTCSLTGDT